VSEEKEVREKPPDLKLAEYEPGVEVHGERRNDLSYIIP
jgi:hypothetical protein